MIIRKPYAILIKHFKLIHAALCMAMFFLIYKTGMISKFFADYFANGENIIGSEVTDGLFNIGMYLAIIGIVIGLVAILLLMIMKKKPIKYYIGSIATYIIFLIFINVDNTIISQMEAQLLSARTVKAMSDLTLIMLIIQVVVTIMTFIRATGFNIKQFDFEKDMQELDIVDSDHEEVEVGVTLDTGKYKRNIRRNIRHIKYAYLENKLICNIVIGIIVIFLGYNIYTKSGLNEKKYSENQYFPTNNFMVNINESYITNTDYKNNLLANGKTLVVLRMSVKNKYTIPVKMEMARAELKVGNSLYYPTKKYLQDMLDLGNTYDSKKIGNEEEKYILCYEVPTNYLNKKMTFQYVDSITGIKRKLQATFVKATIKPTDLRDNLKTINYSLGDTIDMTKTILGKSTFKINNYNINDEYKLTYNFCATNSECYQSNEYIKPNILTNYDKTLLKLNVDYKLDNDFSKGTFTDTFNFISTFGKLEYTLNGKTKIHNLDLKKVTPSKANTGNDIYIEVLKEVKDATDITLVLKIKNQVYRYNILKSVK